MAKPDPGAEGSGGPQAQPELPEQARHAAGTEGQAIQPGDDQQTAQQGRMQHHPVVLAQQAQRAEDLQLDGPARRRP